MLFLQIQEVLTALTENSDKTVTIMSEVKDIMEQQEQKIQETNLVFQADHDRDEPAGERRI